MGATGGDFQVFAHWRWLVWLAPVTHPTARKPQWRPCCPAAGRPAIAMHRLLCWKNRVAWGDDALVQPPTPRLHTRRNIPSAKRGLQASICATSPALPMFRLKFEASLRGISPIARGVLRRQPHRRHTITRHRPLSVAPRKVCPGPRTPRHWLRDSTILMGQPHRSKSPYRCHA